MKKSSLSPLFFIIMISFVEIVYAEPIKYPAIKLPSSCLIVEGLKISVYDLKKYTQINHYAEFEKVISTAKEKTKLIISDTIASISTVGIENDHLLRDKSLTIIEGYIKVPSNGQYIFEVNAYDAVDVLIDNKLVSYWYGRHGRSATPDSDYRVKKNPMYLNKGYHKLEFRHHKNKGVFESIGSEKIISEFYFEKTNQPIAQDSIGWNNWNEPVTELGISIKRLKDIYQFKWRLNGADSYQLAKSFFHCVPLDFEYRFDDCYDYIGNLGEVTDSSGNNYHGVASGKVMSPEKGIINKSITTNDIISSRSPTDIGAKGSISFWYWYTKKENGGEEVMLIDATKGNKYFFLQLTPNQSLLFWADNAHVREDNVPDYNFRARIYTELNWKDGWNHIVMTWNYTDVKFNLYLNDKQEKLKNLAFNASKAVIPSLSNIHIGNVATNGSTFNYRNDSNYAYSQSKNPVNEKFDEFKAYRGELSAAEVHNIYKNEKEGKNMDGTTRKVPCCCRPTNGNLIANPSFEVLCNLHIIGRWHGGSHVIRKKLCGWNLSGGKGIVTIKPEISTYIRLDGHLSSNLTYRVNTIWQLVNSVNGKNYTIKFDYKKSKSDDTKNWQNLIVKWNDKIIPFSLDSNSFTSKWQIATATVVGTANNDKFSLEVKKNSPFVFIDNIRVVEAEPTKVPVSIFDAWDINKNINKRTISTKKVLQNFNLSIVSLTEDNSALQDYNGTVCVRLIGENNSTWKKVELTSNSKNTTFTVNRAYKDTRVKIVWKNEVDEPCPVSNETNSTKSSDNFAIRPDKFNLTLPALAYAGDNFNIDFAASSVRDYNETLGSSFNIESNISRCIDGSLHVTPFSFENGAEKSVDANYTDIGDINITIKEILGSEFAVVDKDDTSVENRLITPDTKNMIIKPYELNITDVKYDEGWLYMADVDDINQSVEFSVLANNKQHILVKNFTEYCYAEDVDVKTHFNVKNINSNVEIKYNNATIYNIKDINKTITIPKASFINSKANIEYSFNVVRAYKIPYEPIQIGLREVSVESSNVAKEKNNATVSLDAEFYYGRVKTKDLSTNEQSTPHSLHVEVYKLGKYKQNSLNWYVNEDDNDSNMTIVDKKDFLFHSANAELDNIGNKQASDGSVEFILKHSEKDSFKSYLHVNIPEYLWYSKYNSYNSVVDCGSHPCFEYNYIGDRSQKNINSGKFIGTAVGDDFNATKTKKGVKVFR